MALILIVDDVEDGRVLLARVLQFGGHATLMAADGPEALRLIEERWPDLVLLDVSMPAMDGFEVLTAFRERFPAARTAVAMLTAFADPALRERAIALGARDYIVKGSFDINGLLTRVAGLTSHA